MPRQILQWHIMENFSLKNLSSYIFGENILLCFVHGCQPALYKAGIQKTGRLQKNLTSGNCRPWLDVGGFECVKRVKSGLRNNFFNHLFTVLKGFVECTKPVQYMHSFILGFLFLTENFFCLLTKCYLCLIGSRCQHCQVACDTCYNCHNLSCSLVFVACPACAARFRCCCSADCAAGSVLDSGPRNSRQIDLKKTIGRGEHYRQLLTQESQS
jgi:hypothetical protein